MSDPDFVDVMESRWRQIHPDVDMAPFGIVQRLIRAGRLAEAELKAVAAKHDIRVRGDYETLAALRTGEPLTPLELANQLRVSTSGMTGRLDRLTDLGLIERAPHPEDRRALLVSLTAAGRDRADAAFRSSIAAQAGIVGTLQPAESKVLAELLRALLAGLDE